MKCLSVDEFCKTHGISRSFFYKLAKQGEGPRTFKIGKLTRISEDASSEWISAHEAASQTTAA